MKAFVTGATGLLGLNLIEQLTAQGWQVRALARDPRKAERWLGRFAGVEVVRGEMGNVESFAPALAGCEVLFHGAAYFRESFQPGEHWQQLVRINVEGTLALLAAAEREGVGRVIYVSSAGVIGTKPDGSPGDESTPPGVQAAHNLYFRSKVLAEQRIGAFLRNSALPVVLILPGWMFGPNDTAPTSSGQLVLDCLQRKLPGIVDGGASIVDARDTAAAMLAAVERGKSGRRYIVGGRFYTLREIVQTIAQISGVPAPAWTIPTPAMMAFAWCAETYSRLSGKPILISRDAVEGLTDRVSVDSSRALAELGIRFRPLAETLRDEVHWFRQNGCLRQVTFAQGHSDVAPPGESRAPENS